MPIANGYKYNEKIIPFRLHESEAKKNAKVKIYPDKTRCKIICWDKPMYLVDGYEKAEINFFNKIEEEKTALTSTDVARKPEKGENKRDEVKAEKNRADSVKRAKDKIFEIAIANKWEYMITLTLDGDKIDRYSKEEVLKVIGKWFDNQVQRKELKYLVVPELHKDGAIHFHGLVSGKLKMKESGTFKIPNVKKPVKVNTLTRRGLKKDSPNVKIIYNVNDFPYGFSTAVKLDGQAERVAVYMTKYITKDLQKIFGSYYKAGGKIKRNLDYILMDVDFVQMLEFADCKTVVLADNYGSVRYATADLVDLFRMQDKVYDVVGSDEGYVCYIDENGVVCDERSYEDVK